MTDTHAHPQAPTAHLERVLARNLALIERNVAGLSLEDSLRRLLPEGSHLNWLLAHLVVSRDGILRLLGAEPVWGEAERRRYGRGSSPEAGAELPLEALRPALEQAQERLARALAGADAQQLAAPREGGGTVGDFVEFLVWHECYHMGQLTLYRRLAGLESPVG